MSDYQLIVIGAGPGGYEAALHAAGLGLQTAVVENREAGGTCLNRGCIPTKTLLHASELVHAVRSGEQTGITVENLNVDLPAVFARKNEVTGKLRKGVETLLQNAKVALLRGTGTICGKGSVKVTGEDGESVYTADHILIATGSVPARPPIPGLELPGVMTSDELLEGTDRLYPSMVIIGGGVIGVEFATFYNDLGCEVTIVEGLDRLLPNMDKELGQNLGMILKRRGIKIQTGAMVSGIRQEEGELAVHFTCKEKEGSANGEVVLCAIGRRPNTAGLFADGVALEMDRGSIRVDESYQTSMEQVYAIGDVSSRIQLAHVATAQGIACVDRITGADPAIDCSVIPSCIYCRPEIAAAGMSEAEAKAAGFEVITGKCVMFGNAKAVIADSDRSFVKIVAEAGSGRILGAQFMCEHATDMISQITAAIVNGLTAGQLRKVMRPHPTFEEALTEALGKL